VNRAQVGILKESDQVSLGSFLEGHDSGALEPQAALEVLGDFSDEALEGELSDEKLSRLLVTTDFSESDCSRPVPEPFLDFACGRGAFPGGLGLHRLSRPLPSGGLTGCLFGPRHQELGGGDIAGGEEMFGPVVRSM